MDFRRGILYVLLAVLGAIIWHTWQLDNPSDAVVAVEKTTVAAAPNQFAPTAITENATTPVAQNSVTPIALQHSQKLIDVKTDVLDAQIDLVGGNLVSAKLLKYSVSLEEKNTPTQILNANDSELYIAQSGLSTQSGASNKPIVYQSAKTNYVMQSGEKNLVVMLTGKSSSGLSVQKIFTFTQGDYTIKTSMQLKNTSGRAWSGNIYNQIVRRNVQKEFSLFSGMSRGYNGAAISTPGTPYKKLTYSDLNESDLSRDLQNGWIAMQQQYFISAWIPPKNQTLHFYSRAFGGNVFVLGMMSAPIHLSQNAQANFDSTLYVGPEIGKDLKVLAPSLDLTVDYGWLWPISKFLFWLLNWINHYLGNWGWSIVVLTVLIKIAFYWFSNKSYASMARTRDLQPKIKALRDRLGDDKRAMSMAMMELYRKEKVNPMGGCLPMLIQFPVFIALYYVLIESVELRQAPFIFWIHDLSVRDPYFVFPILMGLSMLLQQKLSPPPPDPAQAKMMMMLPVIFTAFFATFPAGLVVYWLTNNCVSILQQWFVMRTHSNNVKNNRAANQ